MLNPKSEYRNSKQYRNNEIQNPKRYDLEERCFEFAKAVRNYLKKLPKTLSNIEYARQLIRSAGSVGANYIEANEALGKKDFLMRIKISRKEAKESIFWLRLIEPIKEEEKQQIDLIQEANELMKIFGSIYHKSK